MKGSPSQSCQPAPGWRPRVCWLPLARRGCYVRWARTSMRVTWFILAALVITGCKREALDEARRPIVLFPAPALSGPLDEAGVIAIGRRSVATNDGWADRATFEAKRDGNRWLVFAQRIEGYYGTGEPKLVFGGHRLIVIATNGAVTRYILGR